MIEMFKAVARVKLEGGKEAEKGLDKVDSKARGLGGRIGGAAKKVGKAGLVIGGAMAAAGTAAGAAMVKYGNFADEMLDLSAITGLSTDEMQKWRQLAIDAGVDSDIVAGSLTNLNKQIERGNDLSPRLAKGFDAMGVSAEEFKNMEADEQMRSIVGQMMEMEDADRRAFANQMNMADMLPLISEMESRGMELDEIMDEIDVPFGEDELNSMNEFRKTWDNFKQTIFEVLGQALMPLFEWFNSNMPLIKEIIQTAFDVINETFSTFIGWIQTAVGWFSTFQESNSETMMGIWETIQEYLTLVRDYWVEVWNRITSFWEESGQALLENALTVFSAIFETIETAFNAVWDVIQEILNLVSPFIQEQLAKIQEFWEENGQQIVQAVENYFSILQGIIEFVMDYLTVIIQGAWDIISSIFDAAVGIIMGIVKTLSSLLTGDFEGIKKGLIQIWESLWDGIKGIIEGAWSLLSGAFSSLWESVSGWFTDIASSAFDWGKGMIDGFIDGIKSMAGKVADAAKGVVDSAADFLKFWSPAKKGEGRFVTHWGRNMVDGFLDGVEDEEDSAGQSMNAVVKRMNPKNVDLNNVAGSGTTNNNQTTNDNRTVNITVDAGNMDELMQVIEIFTGLKQTVRKG